MDGKVARVPGGDVGLATAEALAKAGASVVVSDYNTETVSQAAADLRAAGHDAIEIICDVTDTDQVKATAQGSGAIVNCSSIGGLKGSRGRSAYSASKHAVIGLTRSAAIDYARAVSA